MTTLPQHIESYLLEAGFTATEILILKRLLEGHAMTLREIAAKTGKSTGVLDQATKKLTRKKILTKEVINDSPKYVLSSMNAIADWMKKDMQEKHDILKRKQENFESFIATLNEDNARPEMEHFQGLEGLATAYKKLLECHSELLCYKPVTMKEEDDPLRAFFVQFFRERHRKSVFLRTIAQNAPLARRYKSRDIFEYRETMLSDGSDMPQFEKIICGDIVACFNLQKQVASFIHYPELADTERALFEAEWKRLKSLANEPTLKEDDAKPVVAASTKTIAHLREFFLSRRSLAFMAAFGLIAAGITYTLYRHNVYLNTQRVRERAISIAATGALQFDAKDLDILHVLRDTKREEYKKVVRLLQGIQQKNQGVLYSYILRTSNEEEIFEFIAANDAMDPFLSDTNFDGKIDEIDDLGYPGVGYYVGDHDVLRDGMPEIATATTTPYTDQWGTFISGFAPIHDSNGKVAALLAIDLEASDVYELTSESFNHFAIFSGLLFLLICIRLAAFNRSLFQELIKICKSRFVLLPIIFGSTIFSLILLGLYFHTKNLLIDEIGNRLKDTLKNSLSDPL